MATKIGTLTIKGDDLGNSPSYSDIWLDLSNNDYISGGFSSLTEDTLEANLDEYIALVNSSYTGTITYTMQGSGEWNGGSDTVVTLTYTDMFSGDTEITPYLLVLTTEANSYPIIWEATPEVCEGAYELTLTACEGNYVIPAGLTPTSNYYFSIETNRNKRYVQPVSTNVDGDVQLWANAPEFPTGFFTPEMMTMTGKVYSDSDLTNQEQFTIDNTIYNSININFIYTIITSD